MHTAPASLGGTRPSSVYSSLEWLEIIQLFNSFPPCWDGVVWFLIGTRVFQLLGTLLVTLVMRVPRKPGCLSFSRVQPKQCTLKQPAAFAQTDPPYNGQQNHDKMSAFCPPLVLFLVQNHKMIFKKMYLGHEFFSVGLVVHFVSVYMLSFPQEILWILLLYWCTNICPLWSCFDGFTGIAIQYF